MGRSIGIILLIIVVLMSINPQAQTKISSGWDRIRPAVVESMDNLYAAVRTLVAGTDSDHKLYENPVPPDANFDVIITRNSDSQGKTS
jgi:hypothetical protein